MKNIVLLFFIAFFFIACDNQKESGNEISHQANYEDSLLHQKVYPGAESLAKYIPLLKNKRVGLVVNHTSRVGDNHLIDTLLSLDVGVRKLFTPEHGFTGTADAGEKVSDSRIDGFREIPIISLYGKKRKPLPRDVVDIEVMIFDLQDVGARFYTYISTLHYIMESCAENNIPLIVLDRPNPNGHYVDGPILEKKYRSFVGMHPIPLVYGLTMGELARMINGEGWLNGQMKVDLSIIENVNYTHNTPYKLPIAPSPNLPTELSIQLYPSTCFFEGTPLSEGRGTDQPFTMIGHPAYKDIYPFSFTPMPNVGAKNPKLEGKLCYGYDLRELSAVNVRAKGKLELKWLIDMYQNWKGDVPFFNENGWIDKLAGTDQLRKDIEAGKSVEEIRAGWQDELDTYLKMRKKYLLYPDFME